MSNQKDKRDRSNIPKIDAIRLTNGIIALTARLATASVLALIKASQRKRPRR